MNFLDEQHVQDNPTAHQAQSVVYAWEKNTARQDLLLTDMPSLSKVSLYIKQNNKTQVNSYLTYQYSQQ
jgi:hypothetical protein